MTNPASFLQLLLFLMAASLLETARRDLDDGRFVPYNEWDRDCRENTIFSPEACSSDDYCLPVSRVRNTDRRLFISHTLSSTRPVRDCAKRRDGDPYFELFGLHLVVVVLNECSNYKFEEHNQMCNWNGVEADLVGGGRYVSARPTYQNLDESARPQARCVAPREGFPSDYRYLLSTTTTTTTTEKPPLLCTENAPLQSDCGDDRNECEKVEFNNDNAMNCSKSMLVTDDEGKKVEISSLQCDKKIGEWKAINADKTSEIVVKNGSNVYCSIDPIPCNVSGMYPECELDEECTKYDYSDYKFTCPSPATIWNRHNEEDSWRELTHFDYFNCIRGKLHFTNGPPIPDGRQLRCSMHSVNTANRLWWEERIPPYSIAIGIIAFFLIIAAFIVYCFMRSDKAKWDRTSNMILIRNRYTGVPSQTPNIQSNNK